MTKEVKDGDLIFEYPDDETVDKADYEEAVEVKQEEDVKQAKEADDIELEIEDDTPPEDRNKEPLPQEIKEELEKEELSEYSDRVKTRFAQMKKSYHDERRLKEAAERQMNEAIELTQRLINENKKLKTTLSSGEVSYLDTLKKSAESELALAKEAYRKAYESGETDSIIDAQTKMNEAQFKLSQAQTMQPQYKEEDNEVEVNNMAPTRPKLSERDRNWQDSNPWFGPNRIMTSLALGVHEDLKAQGYVIGSDEYYRRIDNVMHQKFPEFFGKEESPQDEDKPAQRAKPSNVVAPATRSTAPKKVQLKTSQINLAKKLGISPEAYAKEYLKLERSNG